MPITIKYIIPCGLMIYSIINIILAIITLANLDFNMQNIKDITDNWQSNTILDIKIENACSSGYETAIGDTDNIGNLSSFAFVGVKNGCWCGNANPPLLKFYNITCNPFCANYCSATDYYAGCISVHGKYKESLNYFTMLNNKKAQLCIKRSNENLYKMPHLIKLHNMYHCPDGYMACGNSSNADIMFCTKEKVCPITKIDIVDEQNVKIIKNIRSDTVSNMLPLAQFALNEYSMCNLAKTPNISPNRMQFTLLNKKIQTCNKEGEKLWDRIDVINEEVLFDLNDISKYINYLNYFTTYSMRGYYQWDKTGADYNYGLFSRSYIPWRNQCRQYMYTVINSIKMGGELTFTSVCIIVINIIIFVFALYALLEKIAIKSNACY